MRIGINAISASQGGGLIYLRNLVSSLASEGRSHQFFVFCSSDNFRHFRDISPINVTYEVHASRQLLRRAWFEQVVLPYRCATLKLDVLYSPAEIAPLAARMPIVLGIQNAKVYQGRAVVGDLRSLPRLLLLRILAGLSVRRSQAVVFVSEWARREIAPRLRVPPERQRVVYHGIDPGTLETLCADIDEQIKRRRRARKIILCVSNFASHKNHELLIHAVSFLREDIRRDILLVMVGYCPPKVGRKLEVLLDELKLKDSVWLVGEIEQRQMAAFYRAADVFVQPSQSETFGMTALEAMAFGTPSICSTAGALSEVAGDSALYFDYKSAEQLRDAITAVLEDPNAAGARAEIGKKRSQQFQWCETARKMLDIFESCSRSETTSTIEAEAASRKPR